MRVIDRRSERGFTLIEIIMVIVIIVLLSGWLLGALGGGKDSALAGMNKAKMAGIKAKIDIFRMSYGSLPPSIEDLYRCTDKTGGGCVPLMSEAEARDPWGNPYVYLSQDNGRSYLLKSLGSDGVEGGEGVSGDFGIKGP